MNNIFQNLPNDIIMKIIKEADGGRNTHEKKFKKCLDVIKKCNDEAEKEANKTRYDMNELTVDKLEQIAKFLENLHYDDHQAVFIVDVDDHDNLLDLSYIDDDFTRLQNNDKFEKYRGKCFRQNLFMNHSNIYLYRDQSENINSDFYG